MAVETQVPSLPGSLTGHPGNRTVQGLLHVESGRQIEAKHLLEPPYSFSLPHARWSLVLLRGRSSGFGALLLVGRSPGSQRHR